MSRQTMEIPAPLAERGDIVSVVNYRRKSGYYDTGRVTSVAYKNDFGRWYWSYTVKIDRKSYNLHLADCQIVENLKK